MSDSSKSSSDIADKSAVDPDEDPSLPKPRRRSTVIMVIVGLAVIVLAWFYVLFLYHPVLLIDELADKTFPNAAEQICSQAVADLDALPFANQATSPENRANNLEQSNVILRTMISDLRPLTPSKPDDAHEAITEWLGDWDIYIGDRESYVDRLRDDPRARFLETAKGDGTKGITRAIDGYAQVNSMLSCMSPNDVS